MSSGGFFNFLQRLADFLAVIVAFFLGYQFYLSKNLRSVPYSLGEFLALGAGAGFIYLVSFQAFRLYQRERSLLNVVETKKLLLAWAVGSLGVLVATFYSRVLDLSRIMITVSLGFSLGILILQRALFLQWAIRWAWKNRSYGKAAIYGAGVVGRHLLKRIVHSPALGIQVEGFLDDNITLWGSEIFFRDIGRGKKVPVLGGMDTLSELIRERGVKEVYVAMPTASYQRNLEIAESCRKLGASVSIVPPTYGTLLHTLEIRDIGGIPVIQERSFRPAIYFRFLKRLVDLTGAAFLLLTTLPISAAVAIIIKLDSPGPVLFRQKRVGKNGVEFDFFKFRSMHVSANPYGVTPKESSDPRITRFGRWLRRSSLDELPQVWNVIRGEMSLVGPRPEMPFIVATYNEEQRQRLSVKPGITGVWQISAVRGEAIHANLEYDLFYIQNQSVLLDIIIIIKTVGTAIRGIGAV